uniref:NDK domain-containing protein n=1 Tax=Macrostomum lignano TaxID=282301 RepID=A0A1I8JPE5_9PLAT
LADLLFGKHVNACCPASSPSLALPATTSRSGASRQRNRADLRAGGSRAALRQGRRILEAAQAAGLSVANLRMGRFGQGSEALEFYPQPREGKSFLPQLARFAPSRRPAPIMAIELMSPTGGADQPEAPLRARTHQQRRPRLRQRGERPPASSASSSRASGAPSRQHLRGGEGCTCGLVKPHAVASGCLGQILSRIAEAGFSINAIAMFPPATKANAEEFLEVYKGVVAEYSSMVAELTSGPCVVLEIGGPGDVYKEFREFCGPADPWWFVRRIQVVEGAKFRFSANRRSPATCGPRTLAGPRRRFGKDKVQNAVHCTDLPEDTQLEVQYFFEILDKYGSHLECT